MKRGGKGLKRSGFKRRSKPLPKKYKPTKAAVTASTIDATKRFKAAAAEQGACAVCGDINQPWDAHHVIEKSWLRDNGFPLWVAPNALRLCNQFAKNDCHGKHTRRFRKVRLKELTDDNIDYAFALLGVRAYAYLTRNYAGKDPRVERALEELEAA